MKYLRNFNESVEEYTDVEKIQILCLDNLSYLIDSGLIFRVYKEDSTTGISIFLEKDLNTMTQFNLVWDDISSDFIPFLHILSDRYSIFKDKIRFLAYLPNSKAVRKDFLVSDVLNDTIIIEEPYMISKIIIVLDKKAK
jgi:hypothetical protein